MAALNRHVVSEMLQISRGFSFGLKQVTYNRIGVRNLYSEAALGVDNYVKTRDRVKSQFVNMSDKFRLKMQEFSEPSSTNMIFTEDLKNMIHLAEPKSPDVELIVKMLERFNSQNKELRFGNFVFGPVVMRMFFFLNEPQAALDCFKNPELSGFFDQLISYQVLMDLLFVNKMYNEVNEVMEIIKSKQLQDARYPKNAVVLTFAACYKLNTPESLKYAVDLWKLLQQVGHHPLRRSTTFAAALAINQNSPHIALEILSSVRQQNYITVRNIKVSALADIGRPDDTLPILRSVLEVDDPTQRKQTFTKDVIERVKKAFELSPNKDAVREFLALEKSLSENGHITENLLDEHLCSEITLTTGQVQQSRDRRFLAASFSRQGGRDDEDQNPREYNRPPRDFNRAPRDFNRQPRDYDRPRSYNRPGLEDLH